MQIPPWVGVILNIIFTIATGIAAGTLVLAGLSDATAHTIRVWAANGAFVISCVNTVLHLYSSPQAGPLAK
jgi:hypothetical protein